MDKILDSLGARWKAVVGFVVPGVVIILSAITDSSDGGSNITQNEWITAAAACVLTSAGVYAKGNKDKRGAHQDESVQPPERGAADVVTVLLIVVLVVVLCVLLGFGR